jgi:serine phosphatase RsbU (regulator of sigma subunit)/Tfp pilus assembly protein PilF
MRRQMSVIFFLFLAGSATAQVDGNTYVDSMKILLEKADSDSSKSLLFISLSGHYLHRNSDSSLFCAEQGLIYARKIEDDDLISNSLNAIGNVYNNQGKFGEALDVFVEALSYAQKINDNRRMARINNNIGIVYYYQQDMSKALDYFQKTANILITEGDTMGAIYAFNNIGGIYLQLKQNEESMAYFQRGYKLTLEVGDDASSAILLTGIASVHAVEKEYQQALEEFHEALEMKRRGTNIGTIVHSLLALGDVYDSTGQDNMAIFYFEEMADLSLKAGMINMEKNAYQRLALCYENVGNDSKSLIFLKKYNVIRDSLESIANIEAIAEVQSKYDNVQHQKKIEILEKNSQLRHAEMKRKEAWNMILIGGAVIILILAFLIYGRLRTSRQQNRIIREQKKLVDTKNKEVFDSINYAKHIQQAMLSAENTEGQQLPEHFILFKPKDIVSGDFYWTILKKNHFYLAAVDCTGHGVPGAFLTLLGSAFLNEIVSRDENISPATILNELRERMINELRQSEEVAMSKDGMDISLIKVNKNDLTAEWAGANNPLWIIRNAHNEIEEIKGDKEHIGYSYQMTPFTNHDVKFSKGDQFYLFSDGFADQFGVDLDGKEKKYKGRNLKELLIEVKDRPAQEQSQILNERFENWKGDLEQLDDVCVIGVRVR